MNSESYEPPLIVHVFWSPKSAHPLCAEVGRALYEFLSRPVVSDPVGRFGAGIPVRLGYHGRHALEAVQSAIEDRSLDRPCIVAVPLLDHSSRIDAEFSKVVEALWKMGGQEGWPRVLVLPVLLDDTWIVPNEIAPCRSARFVSDAGKPALVVEEVSVGICHFLMDRVRSDERQRVQIFISHAKSDLAATDQLAEKLREHIGKTELKTFFDASDVARGRDLSSQFEKAGQQAVFLSLRTDGYSGSPWCLDEVLIAKKHGVPVICVQALAASEQRSLAYGGNAFTYVRRKSSDELSIITAMCLQAWLRHLHFHHAAPAICRMRQISVRPCCLSRPPELIDFAQNLLPRGAALVVHPDPPLPQSELAIIGSEYPKVRLATPSTLDRELLRRDAALTLDGARIALSLSDGPEIPVLAVLSPAHAASASRGLTTQHIREVIELLTLSLVRAGAALGYGGDHREKGYTDFLSGLIEAHKRTTKTSKELLHNYIASYLWNDEAARKVRAHFIPIEVPARDGRAVAVQQALELAAMRRRMAEECDARIIMGGKSAPKAGSGGSEGYSGRLPGQAEEAWRHMDANKPVYVVGGFGGCAAFVANALCGNTNALPSEKNERAGRAEYAQFCDDFDRDAAPLGLALPGGCDALWAFFAEAGRGFFHGDGAEETKQWRNGLTVAENRRLFASTHPEEITALFHLGQRRLREARRKQDDAPLKVLLFQGSIADAREVDCYVVALMEGAPLRGADGALDAATDGAIRRHLEQKEASRIVPVKDNRLAGDYVLLHTFGDLSGLGNASVQDERSWLLDRIRKGIVEILASMQRFGLRSVAVVPFGTNLGLSTRESVNAILEALVNAKAGHHLTAVTLCEIDPERYIEILRLKNDPEARLLPASERRITFTELRSEGIPVGRAPTRPAILLEVQRQPDGLTILAHAPWSGTALPIQRKTVDWKKVMTLTYALGKGEPPPFGLQPSIGAQLAAEILPAQAAAALKEHPGTPIDILHGVEAAAIPFELLQIAATGDASHCWPALAGGIRRCLLTLNLPERHASISPGVRRRMLLVADPDDNLPHARREAENILQTFHGRSDMVITPLIGKQNATHDAVIEKLKNQHFDILHFAGHAQFNSRERGQSGLLLADGKLLSSQDLIAAQIGRLPALVFLNACEGGRVRAPEQETPAALPATCDASVAETIIAAGIPAFIGNLWKVRDHAANTFAVSLYGELAEGRTLGEAVLAARRKLFAAQQPDWLNYMLYGQADLCF